MRGSGTIIIIIIVLAALLFWDDITGNDNNTNIPVTPSNPLPTQNLTPSNPQNDGTVSIANWNLQIFGVAKWSNVTVNEYIISKVQQYDLIFIQEIRDSTGTAFSNLCLNLEPTYKCNITSRAGRSISKEQYGIIYKANKVHLSNMVDYNQHFIAEEDYWERPPVRADFQVDNYNFSVWNIHTKPDDVDMELTHLEILMDFESNTYRDNVLLIGDLNADGSYYDEDNRDDFLDWRWIVKNDEDTTVNNNTYYAYDRIIINDEMYEEFKSYGIDTSIPSYVSDHYLVWTKINPVETGTNTTGGTS